MFQRIAMKSAVLAVAIALSLAAHASADQLKTVNVPPGDLGKALRTLADQVGVEFMYQSDQVRGMHTGGVSGDYSARDAVIKLLEGTSLELRTDENSGALLIKRPSSTSESLNELMHRSMKEGSPPASQPIPSNGVQSATAPASEEQPTSPRVGEAPKGALEEILITGSRIPGVAATLGQTKTFSRDEIEETGLPTVESFFESRPENFSAFSFDGNVATNSSALQGGNLEGAEAIDLRGLGPQSTLVLVNGRRRAGAVQGRVVDVSTIPLSLIDRVDIVTGGHSAVYGSDAVAGVVNFIPRRTYDGAQTRLIYGDSEHSSGELFQFSQTLGRDSERGGFVIAYDYVEDQSLDLLDTGLVVSPSIFGIVPQVFDLTADRRSNSVFASGKFRFSEGVEWYGDAQYVTEINEATRNFSVGGFQIDTFNRNDRDQLDLASGIRIDVNDSWTVDFGGNHSKLNTKRSTDNVFGGFPAPLDFEDEATLSAVSVLVNGSVDWFSSLMPQVAFGAEYRDEELDITQVGVGATSESRSITSAFGEILLPVWHSRNAADRELDVSLAARYDDYSDFGDTFNPQVGIAWKPLGGLKLTGSYSTAFRAPSLQDSTPLDFVFLNNVNNPVSGGPPVPVLIRGGNNPDVSAEEAETWAFGIEFASSVNVLSRVYASYFDIEYEGRIDVPAFSEAAVLQQAERYVGLINESPTSAELGAVLATDDDGVIENSTGTPFDPASQELLDVFPNLVVFDNRLNNIGVESVNGVDFGFTLIPGLGAFSVGLDGTYTLDHERSITRTSPASSLLNDVGLPPDLRMRGRLQWRHKSVGASTFINYTDSYKNTRSTPVSKIESWTTVDLVFSYQREESDGSSFLSGLGLTLSAINVLGERPPTFLENTFGIRYDTANANALGRYISLQVSKDW